MDGNKTLTANFQIKDVTPPEVPATLIWDAETGYYQYNSWHVYNDGYSSTNPPREDFNDKFVAAGGTVTYTGRTGNTDNWVGAGVGFAWIDGDAAMDISDRSGVWVTYSLSGGASVYIHVSTTVGEGGPSLTGNNHHKTQMPTGTNVRKFFSFSSFQQQTGWGVILPIQTALQNCTALNFEFSSTGTATLTIKKIEWDAGDVR
jgi:hypothetical protein